jgi:hypothetical protein
VQFGISDFYENLLRYPDLVKTGQKYKALYMKTQLHFMLLAATCSATIHTTHCCVFMAMLEMLIMLLTATWYVNNTKGMHCFVSMVTMTM